MGTSGGGLLVGWAGRLNGHASGGAGGQRGRQERPLAQQMRRQREQERGSGGISISTTRAMEHGDGGEGRGVQSSNGSVVLYKYGVRSRRVQSRKFRGLYPGDGESGTRGTWSGTRALVGRYRICAGGEMYRRCIGVEGSVRCSARWEEYIRWHASSGGGGCICIWVRWPCRYQRWSTAGVCIPPPAPPSRWMEGSRDGSRGDGGRADIGWDKDGGRQVLVS